MDPEEYMQEFTSKGILDDEILKEEIEKWELYIRKLEESNEILIKESDEICQESYRINMEFLQKYRDILQRVRNLNQNSGIFI